MKITATYREIETVIELYPIGEVELTTGQKAKSEAFGATHVFKFRDVMSLPKYIRTDIKKAGFEFTKIGHTSYESSTWGARRI